MAEFFDIPHKKFKQHHKYTIDELNQSYSQADFTTFNETFPSKFEAFERFLIDHRIVTHINEKNSFLQNRKEKSNTEYCPNIDKYAKYRKKLKREALFLNTVNNCLNKR
jgi:hypothetical protein